MSPRFRESPRYIATTFHCSPAGCRILLPPPLFPLINIAVNVSTTILVLEEYPFRLPLFWFPFVVIYVLAFSAYGGFYTGVAFLAFFITREKSFLFCHWYVALSFYYIGKWFHRFCPRPRLYL